MNKPSNIFMSFLQWFESGADMREGFQGLHLGMYKDDLPDSETHTLKIGEFDILPISCAFHKDVLTEIIIPIEKLKNCRGILEILKSKYGAGLQPDKRKHNHIWCGKKHYFEGDTLFSKRTRVTYTENYIEKTAVVRYY